jgi:RNA polymerase sigma-70 factor (ECF subfamily)
MADRGPEDEERFSNLFRDHYQDLLSFARRRVTRDLAPEVVAETFLVAWRRFHDAPDHALPWLYRIAGFQIANLRRGELRRARLLGRIAQHASTSTSDPFSEDPPEAAEFIDVVIFALQSLREVDQEVLRLAAWEGLGAADAATVLGCTSSAYRVRLHRARRRLERRAQELTLSRSRTQSQRSIPAASMKAMVVPRQGREHQ